jgi:hypothetical protein
MYSIVKTPVKPDGTGGVIDTGQICADMGAGGATPGLRLHAFASAFANHTIFPICQTDLSPAMNEIADRLVGLLKNTCIQDPLYDIDGDKTNGVQPDCQIDDLIPADNGAGLYKAQTLPACSLSKGMPCWDLDPDPTCGGGYRAKVSRTTPAAPGTLQSIKCLTCPTGHTENCTR